MYEVVKTVNGYEIKRMIGTRGYYEVEIAANAKCKMFRNFRTIKAATAFCGELPPNNNKPTRAAKPRRKDDYNDIH